MKLLRKSDGEWFTHPGGGKFLIRPIPNGKAKEIKARHMGTKHKVELVKGVQRYAFDEDAVDAIVSEKACYALLDSKDADIDVVEGLEAVTKAAVGATFVLDGNWTPEIKAAVFGEVPSLAEWIVGKADSFRLTAKEEEGKGDAT